MRLIRFFLDAIDGLHGVGEPSVSAFHRWERGRGRLPSSRDLRALQGYIRGYKLGKLVGSASLLAAIGVCFFRPTMGDETGFVWFLSVSVFALASPYVLATIGGWWASQFDDEDDDLDGPAPMGGT